MSVATDTPAKLSIWPATVECYAVVFREWRTALTLALPWMIIGLPAFWWYSSVMGAFDPAAEPQAGTMLEIFGASLAVFIIYSAMISAIAVGWHRRLLQGDDAGSFDSLTVTRPKLRYFLSYCGLQLATTPVVLIGAGMLLALWSGSPGASNAELGDPTQPGPEPDGPPTILVAGFFAFVQIAIFLPWLLSLPGTALGKSARFSSIRGRIAGQYWRLVLIGVLCCAPFLAVSLLPDLHSDWNKSDAYLLHAVTSIADTLLLLPFISFLAFAHRHFLEPVSAPTPATAS